jgi:uncharacterized protein
MSKRKPQTPTGGRWAIPTVRSRQWTPHYALLALVVAVASGWGIAIAVGFAGVTIPRGVSVLVIDALFLLTLVPLYRAGALRPVDLGLRRVPGARSVGLAFLALLAYGWCSRLWIVAVHPPPVHSNFAGIASQSTLIIVLIGLAAAVSAPVVEEVFFRGFLYRSLRNRFGIVLSCLIVGVVFGLGHTQYPLLVRPILAAFGVIMCLLYERTGSLLPGIAVHSLIDASGFEYALTGTSAIVFTVFALLALVLLSLPILRRLIRLVARLGALPKRQTA